MLWGPDTFGERVANVVEVPSNGSLVIRFNQKLSGQYKIIRYMVYDRSNIRVTIRPTEGGIYIL